MAALDSTERRPVLIAFFAVFFGFAAAMYSIGIVYSLVADANSYIEYGNERVRIGDVRASVLWTSVIAGAFCFAIAFGFWDGRSWGRHLFMVFIFGGFLIGGMLTNSFSNQVPMIVPMTLAAWYLYFKGNVVGYFRSAKPAD